MKNLMLKQFFFAMLFLLAVILTPETGHAATAHDFFIVVHCEAESPAAIDRNYHVGLKPLVALADAYGIKLTISLSPQWAQHINANPQLLNEVKTWLTEGHNIGILHYGLMHNPTWDFYTNETDPAKITLAGRNPADRIGSMTDLINEVNGLLTSPIVGSTRARQLSMNARDYTLDIKPGILVDYLTDGWLITGDPLNQDVIRKPIQLNINGVTYWKMSMGYFTMLKPNSGCTDRTMMIDLYSLYQFLTDSLVTGNNSDYKFGLATHPLDFIADDVANGGCGFFHEWFSFISGKMTAGEVRSGTVPQIMDMYLGR